MCTWPWISRKTRSYRIHHIPLASTRCPRLRDFTRERPISGNISWLASVHLICRPPFVADNQQTPSFVLQSEEQDITKAKAKGFQGRHRVTDGQENVVHVRRRRRWGLRSVILASVPRLLLVTVKLRVASWPQGWTGVARKPCWQWSHFKKQDTPFAKQFNTPYGQGRAFQKFAV